jgi:hypothetical protein
VAKLRTARMCLVVLGLAGCGAGPTADGVAGSVGETAPTPSPARNDHRLAIRCGGAVGGLISDYAGRASARPPTGREARAAVRERIADPGHALHGKHLRLTAAPHPYNAKFVVVTAATSWGPSTFTVSRGESGGMRITSEELCFPVRKGPALPVTTERPQRVPDHRDTCAGRIRRHPAPAEPVASPTPVRAVKDRIADPAHPLHGKRVYVPPTPKPYGRQTVVVAEAPHGPSRFDVARGSNGGWIVVGERICHPRGARP